MIPYTCAESVSFREVDGTHDSVHPNNPHITSGFQCAPQETLHAFWSCQPLSVVTYALSFPCVRITHSTFVPEILDFYLSLAPHFILQSCAAAMPLSRSMGFGLVSTTVHAQTLTCAFELMFKEVPVLPIIKLELFQAVMHPPVKLYSIATYKYCNIIYI
jgi:hypothetical protein